jgi:hypothetical protein
VLEEKARLAGELVHQRIVTDYILLYGVTDNTSVRDAEVIHEMSKRNFSATITKLLELIETRF